MGDYDKNKLEKIKTASKLWETDSLKAALESGGEWQQEFRTNSGEAVKSLYTPLSIEKEGQGYLERLGFPGEYPYTRGLTPTMYRAELPRIFVYQGYASAEATNQRFKYLLSQGAKQLSIASDLPTQIGLDSDHPLSRGEVGKIGVAINSLADVETIFDGIPLDKVAVGAQTNANTGIMLAFFLGAAEKQGVTKEKMRCFLQNDVLKEFIARGTYIFPPRESLKFSCDVIEYVINKKLHNFSPIRYCGYHFREAGSTAAQEMAFTLANAVAYIEELQRRGISIDDLPQQMALFVAGTDIFEEVAKYRAFRRMWAKLMKERFNAKNPRVLAIAYQCGSQSSQYTAQQPMNNVVRGALSAIVQVLSGVQLMNIGAMDEALSIPTEASTTLALRTMQIVLYESGLVNSVDPLGGSYFLETLTDELEEKATKLFEEVEERGGAVACIEQGFQEKEIGKESYEQLKQLKTGQRVHIGVNKFAMEDESSMQLMKVDPLEEARQIEKLKELKKKRDNGKVQIELEKVRRAATEGVNTIAPIISAVRAYATGGEIADTLREVWGEYKRPVY
ncbi:MAG: methylmalonyl-CoA mutase [Candidatus Thorarchaeota archaeon]